MSAHSFPASKLSACQKPGRNNTGRWKQRKPRRIKSDLGRNGNIWSHVHKRRCLSTLFFFSNDLFMHPLFCNRFAPSYSDNRVSKEILRFVRTKTNSAHHLISPLLIGEDDFRKKAKAATVSQSQPWCAFVKTECWMKTVLFFLFSLCHRFIWGAAAGPNMAYFLVYLFLSGWLLRHHKTRFKYSQRRCLHGIALSWVWIFNLLFFPSRLCRKNK